MDKNISNIITKTSLENHGLKLLFVCQSNVVRSRTAETLWKSYGWKARSAGISEGSRVRISPELIDWSNVIFVMEEYMEEYLVKHFAAEVGTREIVILDVHENFYYMQDELQTLLKEKVEGYLTTPGWITHIIE